MNKYPNMKFIIVIAACLCWASAVDIQHELNEIEKRVSTLENTHIRLHENLHNVESMDLSKPAFSAYLSDNITIIGQTIVAFDTVVYNSGNNYDPGFGFFQCPDTASYFFRLSIASPAGHVSQIYLTVDSDPLLRGLVPKTYVVNVADLSGIHSAGIVVICEEGSYVYAIADAPQSEDVYLLSTLSTFSGYRL